MGDTQRAQKEQSDPGLCEIRVKGHLDERWADWLGQMSIVHEAGGSTLLTSHVVDQAALYRILRKVRDLGMTLLSVIYVDPTRAEAEEDAQQAHVGDSDHSTKGVQ